LTDGVIAASGLVLVLPLSLLLFLQWRCAIWCKATREANDLAQWLFALYVSLATVQRAADASCR
jgi:hypothetical protein